eukprot:jgi/Undpi1/6030/HiC_scaffold_2.g01304.m1
MCFLVGLEQPSLEVPRTRASTEAAQGSPAATPPPAAAASKDDASEAVVAEEVGDAAAAAQAGPTVVAAAGAAEEGVGLGAGMGGVQKDATPIAAVPAEKESGAAKPGTEQQQQQQQQPSEGSPSEPSFSSSGYSPGRAWLPQASFDDESEEAEEGEVEAGVEEDNVHRNEWLGSSSGSAPSRQWPFWAQDAEGSGLGSGLGSGSGSQLSEGPPRLLSSSAESSNESAPDSWDDPQEARWPGACLRPLESRARRADAGGDEEKEDGLSRAGHRSRPMTRKFFVGQWLDVKDTVNNWLEATVMDMTDAGTRLQIHYNGWPPRWDEWLNWDSPRIAPFRTRTQHLPHSQHVSPAPVSAVRNAPITGMDDVRVMMPEVSRVLQEIAPMVDELSACYARNLEQDPSTSPSGERTVSHTLPWTRQRIQQRQQQERGAAESGSAATTTAGGADGISPKAAHLAGDIAPLFDRLGRMLTDVAPHLARLSVTAEEAQPAAAGSAAAEREDAAEPGEVPWGALRRPSRASRGGARSSAGSGRGGGAGGNRPGAVVPAADEAATAFRQLVSTSSPAPTSSNINIHIHAIVPLRAPPSPPPPPPPTASASAVATPTRADRPPLSGSRNPPWSGNMDTVGGSASLIAAARAAAASRAATSARDADTGTEGGTPRRLSRGILAEFARSGGEREAVATAGGEGGAGGMGGAGGGASGGATGSSNNPSRSASVASSVSFDVTGVSASPLTVTTPGSSVVGLGDARPSSGSPGRGGGDNSRGSDSSAAHAGADQADLDSSSSSGGQSGGGQRRGGGWRGLLRALGVGGNGSSRAEGGMEGGGETAAKAGAFRRWAGGKRAGGGGGGGMNAR